MQIPETKPATELIDGRLVQKMSPMLRHQVLEKRWVAALDAWGAGRGEAFTEWRHEFRAPGHTFASLVPDVVYATYARLDELDGAELQKPPRSPEFVVEILSPGQSERTMAWKVGAYLQAGTEAVFVVDPVRHTVIVHALPPGGSGQARTEHFGPGDVVTHAGMPGFAYPIDAMFEGRYISG